MLKAFGVLFSSLLLLSSLWTIQARTAHYRDYFYVGESYVAQGASSIAAGQIYVEKLTPAAGKTRKYPLVFIHGAGMTGTNFLNTPDGRDGWADWFLSKGYQVYIVDQPSRGRSPWQQNVDGPQAMFDTNTVELLFTATQKFKQWPNASLHTQWPGSGVKGDPIFDNFYASMVPLLITDSESGAKNQAALVALLDKINEPVILLTHSQSSLFGWPLADARPSKVKAIVALEPGGPPFSGDTTNPTAVMHPWGLSEVPMTYDPPATNPSQLRKIVAPGLPGYTCYLQAEPARKWKNLKNIPVLTVTSESSWHGIFDDCTVRFIRQAGVHVDFLRLQDVGIHGNGHMFFMEKNNQQIVEQVVGPWIATHDPQV